MPRSRRAALAASAAVLALAACGGDESQSATDRGKAVFAKAGCGTCHTLRDAGATGAVGPNLDELQPNATKVEVFVTNGSPPRMPAFAGTLSEDEIEAVAAYVQEATGAEPVEE